MAPWSTTDTNSPCVKRVEVFALGLTLSLPNASLVNCKLNEKTQLTSYKHGISLVLPIMALPTNTGRCIL